MRPHAPRTLLLITLTALCLTAASATAHAAAGTEKLGHAPATATLKLVLPLKANLAALKQHALAVSTPGSTEYHHYLPISALARRYGASPAGERRALAYLRRIGARSVKLDATGLFIDAEMTTAQAERTFGTELSEFRTRQTTYTAPSAGASIPAALRGVVTGVVGLNTRPVVHNVDSRTHSHLTGAHFATGSTAAKVFGSELSDDPPATAAGAVQSFYLPRTGTPSGCSGAIDSGGFTPNQYLTAYNYAPLQAAGLNGAGERIALVELDGYKQSDIDAFAACFGITLPPIKAFGFRISQPLAPGPETTLDLELLAAVAPGAKEYDVYESRSVEADALEALTAPLQKKSMKPQVISDSLGLCEPFVYGAVGRAGVLNTEAVLEEAAASGITFLNASADSGSASCTQPNGTPIPQLAVNYPASSWWATAVGGTNFTLNAANQITAQAVWNDGAKAPGESAGGGTSRLFNLPPWQKGTVPGNRRGLPDVAMLADIAPGDTIYCSATSGCVSAQNPNPWQTVGGTSASTPLMAGGMALVDQLLAEHGQEPLGLVTPLLYQLGRSSARASVFDDVTQGSNDVGPYLVGRSLGCCSAGVGWDKASGWGGVNLAGFAAAALASPPAIPKTVTLAIPSGQKPLSSHQIITQVSCSSRCNPGAYAKIAIPGQKTLTAPSSEYTLAAAGTKQLPIRFGAKVLAAIRAAVAKGKTVTATIRGVALDANEGILRSSSPMTLKIG